MSKLYHARTELALVQPVAGQEVSMFLWASCNLDEEILSILEEDVTATLRHLCALIYPGLSWQTARFVAADAVRRHCQFLIDHRLLMQVGEDTYALAHTGSA